MTMRRPAAVATVATVIVYLLAVFFSLDSVHSYDPNLIRYRARVAYNGAGFQGFQLQDPPARTVQGELEGVLSERFQYPVRVVGAGRTDAGVHARGQAIHFDLSPDATRKNFNDDDSSLASVQHSLNRMLRSDVRLWNLQVAPPPANKTMGTSPSTELAWNVIYDSTRKLYSYRFSAASVMDPLERHCRWHPDQPSTLDMDMLNATLRCYEGSNDFRAFAGAIEQLERKAGGKRLDTTRIVYSVHLVAEEENDDDDDATGNANYRIDFYLKGALYKQVRNMVGTALDVCRGRLSQQAFAKLLSSDLNGGTQANRDDNPCKPAPPEGLTLEHVYFDNVVNF